jgi:hypothetical protein
MNLSPLKTSFTDLSNDHPHLLPRPPPQDRTYETWCKSEQVHHSHRSLPSCNFYNRLRTQLTTIRNVAYRRRRSNRRGLFSCKFYWRKWKKGSLILSFSPSLSCQFSFAAIRSALTGLVRSSSYPAFRLTSYRNPLVTGWKQNWAVSPGIPVLVVITGGYSWLRSDMRTGIPGFRLPRSNVAVLGLALGS